MLVNNIQKADRYYDALLQRDESFLGTFYVGVRTTGIFCVSVCRARKPKRENVEFFTDVKTVLQHGYRPCKICRPTENAYQPPADILRALELLKDDSKEKVSDQMLREQGLSPEKIRRWFKKHYKLTFQAYQRMIRLNTAFQELKNGESVTNSAYGSGYESLSGFGYTFKKLMGESPEQSKYKTVILITRLTTPLGPMYACATDQGICLLEFTDRRMLETEFYDLQKRLNAVILAGENQHLSQLKQELQEYFSGERKNFEVSLHSPGTDFQQLVWDALLKIPFGKTSTYRQQAQSINRPNSARAVARANGCNRVAIVIPCHRVIGSDGKLTGYAGGLERKRWLLDHERS